MSSTPQPASAWAPLRQPTFRMLWLVWVTANVCLWMNDVAAAWLMTSLTTSPTLIAMVQTASALPVFLLGLPSGALADLVDRRRYFMFTQVWVAAPTMIVAGFGWILVANSARCQRNSRCPTGSGRVACRSTRCRSWDRRRWAQ